MAPPRRSLAQDDVHLWLVDLESFDALAPAALGSLAPDERQRADRMVSPRERRHYATRRVALRRVLSRYVVPGPEELCFHYGPYGKPYLASEPDLAFTVSHSGDRSVIAVARGDAIGVDIERVQSLPDLPALLGVCCDAEEAAGILSQPHEARLKAFYRCWTRRESYLKALGTGIAVGTLEKPTPAIVPPPVTGSDNACVRGASWWTHHVVAPDLPDFTIALTTRRERPTIRLRCLKD